MVVALKDGSSVSTLLAVLNTDSIQGTNLVRLKVNGVNKALKVTTTATISFTPRPIDPRDSNYTGCWLFEGSNGLTYPAVATAAGELLIKTN